MKGFIELHDHYDHKPVLIAISGIVQVQAFYVGTAAAAHYVEEDYATIRALIEEEAPNEP